MPSKRRIVVTTSGEARVLRRLGALFGGDRRRERLRRTAAQGYLDALDDRFGPAPPGVPADVAGLATLVLDASALRAIERGSPVMRARAAAAVAAGARLAVPALALADAAITRTAESLATVVPVDARLMAETTALLERAHAGTTLDALAVAIAARSLPAAIMSADPFALEALVAASGRPIRLLTR